jgi:hypothetical protein
VIKPNNNDTFLIELQLQRGDDPDYAETVEVVTGIEGRRILAKLARPEHRWIDNDTKVMILRLVLLDPPSDDD